MTLQATQEGLIDLMQTYFDAVSERLILLDGSSGLTNASTIVDFLALEPDEQDGYLRQAPTLTGWAWNAADQVIECPSTAATFTASASGIITYDAAALLIGGSATANKPISTIATNTLSTATAHGLNAGDKVFFTEASVPPAGLTLNQIYYVLASGLTSTQFQISTTNGGSVAAIGDTWTGTLLCRYANGKILTWEQRPDDGNGNRTYTINASQSHTVNVKLGIGLRVV